MFDIKNQIHVVENAYEDPDPIRKKALSCIYLPMAGYPGLRSLETVREPILYAKLKAQTGFRLSSRHSPSAHSGCFQLLSSLHAKASFVHSDLYKATCVIYLSRKSPANGGTIFYRHKDTGLERFPGPEELSLVAQTLSLSEHALLRCLLIDRFNRSAWEAVRKVDFSYNRMILYDASLFHCNGRPWGDSIRNGRLTQNYFFGYRERPRPPKDVADLRV